jgi:hypothetical protein
MPSTRLFACDARQTVLADANELLVHDFRTEAPQWIHRAGAQLSASRSMTNACMRSMARVS